MPEALKPQSPGPAQTSLSVAKSKIKPVEPVEDSEEMKLLEGKSAKKRSREDDEDAVDDQGREQKRAKFTLSTHLITRTPSVSILGAARKASSDPSKAEVEVFKTPSRPSTTKWPMFSTPEEIHESPTCGSETPTTPADSEKLKLKNRAKEFTESIRHSSLSLLRHTKSETGIAESPKSEPTPGDKRKSEGVSKQSSGVKSFRHSSLKLLRHSKSESDVAKGFIFKSGPKTGEKRKREDAPEESPSVRSKIWLKSRKASVTNLFESISRKTVEGDDSAVKEDSSLSNHNDEESSDCSPPVAKRPRRLMTMESLSNLREILKIKLSQESGEAVEIKFSIPRYIRKIKGENSEKSNRVEAPRWLKSIYQRPSRRRRLDAASAQYEPVYLVLRPINFDKSAHKMIRKIGEWTDRAELRNFLLFQHWGIQVGEHFYHLHIVDEPKEDGKGIRQRIAVSLCPFEEITLKVPIWRTKKSHEDRVRDAISLIRFMGGYKSDDEVEVYGNHGTEKDTLLPEEERAKYRSSRTFKRFFPTSHRGDYHITFNNCIHFVRRFLFYFIFDVVPFTSNASEFARNLEWLAKTWLAGSLANLADLGKRLTDMFLGLMNPMKRKTLQGGNTMMAHLAMAFLRKMEPEDITRNPVDDGTLSPAKEMVDKPEEISELVEEGAEAYIDDIEDDDDDNTSGSDSDSGDEVEGLGDKDR